MLTVPIDTYVRDAFDGPPSLSSHLAHLLLERSPLHAWTAHPRLNPAWQPDDDRKFDVGTAAHAVLLEGRTVTPLDFDDFRSKAAREARDLAKAAGSLPVLREDAEAIEAMVKAARAKLAACPDLVDLGELLPERTFRWAEEPAYSEHSRPHVDERVWCRCRPDWIAADGALIVSYKTTRASAEPDAYTRGAFIGHGHDLQAAFEMRGVEAVTGKRPRAYVWLVQETEPPYAASLLGLSPMMADLGERRFRAAVNQWAYCLASDRWPAYPERICYVEPPEWALYRWGMKEQAAPAPVIDDGRPLADQLFGEDR